MRARGWAEARQVRQALSLWYYTHLQVSSSPRALCSRRTDPSSDFGRTRGGDMPLAGGGASLLRRPGPLAAKGSSFCPGFCFRPPPPGHHGTLLPPGSASQLSLPHLRDTYFQARRIPPRTLHCGGLWAGEARGGSVPAPGLQVPQELLSPTGCLAISSVSLTPTRAVMRKGRGMQGEWMGSRLGQATAHYRGHQTREGTNPVAHSR